MSNRLAAAAGQHQTGKTEEAKRGRLRNLTEDEGMAVRASFGQTEHSRIELQSGIGRFVRVSAIGGVIGGVACESFQPRAGPGNNTIVSGSICNTIPEDKPVAILRRVTQAESRLRALRRSFANLS